MDLLVLSVGILLSSGLISLVLGRYPRCVTLSGVAGTFTASLLGLIPSLRVFLTGSRELLRASWEVPYGSFYLELDSLSAFFLILIFVLSLVVSIYAGQYLFAFRDKKSLGPPWFFFQLLIAGMAFVVMARNGVLFLVSWEIMSLAAFFLVTFEHEKEKVRDAGWTYLVAAHLGVMFLLALFILLGRESGSLDFDKFKATGDQGDASVLFLLAVVGFGSKAGFVPLHVWLPEAHPAAPSHVSAILSAVMIKTGIYGLLRVLTFLGPPLSWWGYLLCAVGLSSGILGIAFALAQRDLKRLLAYSSIENIGIITSGIGLGLIGLSARAPAVAVLGFAGALLHVWNHSLFKGLLFLAAGSVGRGARTLDLEQMGGLLKRMPWTGGAFLLGGAAIAALPPLNGFSSELLIYLAAFHDQSFLEAQASVPGILVILGLALMGGLAVASFTKAAGIAFLGTPRSERARTASENGVFLRAAMLLLCLGCLLLGLFSPWVLKSMGQVLCVTTNLEPDVVEQNIPLGAGPLSLAVAASAALVVLVSAITLVRSILLSGRRVESAVTWDCGYAEPSPRMQYTASSFAEPLTTLFSSLLRTRENVSPPTGPLPARGSFASETPDAWRRGLFEPLFGGMARALSKIRWLQHGRVQIYVFYIALTILVLLAWKL